MRNKKIRLISVCILLAVIFTLSSFVVSATAPHPGYEYSTDNYNGQITSDKEQANAVRIPQPYAYLTSYNRSTVEGLDIDFNNPEDMLCDESGNLLVLDSGNGRIVLLDSKTACVSAIYTGWYADNQSGDFSEAKGFFTVNGVMYVCLQESSKILILDYLDGNSNPVPSVSLEAQRIVESPNLSAVSENFVFKPSDIVVDNSKRMYVIVQGVYDGLVILDRDGSFLGYMGANKVSMSLWERIWRNISTDAQIEASIDQVPVEFYSMDIDENGFIYTTSKGEEKENTVRKLNLVGNDIIKSGTHYIRGDLSSLTESGSPGTASNLVDIDVTGNGLYAVLDNARGKVFVYDNEGNMLFAFGGISAQKGGFSVPCAITWQNDRLLVLDRGTNEVAVFEPTDYGKTIIKAAREQFGGEYGTSFDSWQEVLKMNPNNEIANCSIGKLMYDKKDYSAAMRYFRVANNKKLYSKAYTKYRSEQMEKRGPTIAFILAAVLLLFAGLKAFAGLKNVRDRWNYFIYEVNKSKKHN